MIRNNYILAAAVSFILLCSCNGHVLKGEGPKTTTNFQVGNFQSLDIAVSVKAIINVVAGASPKVEVSGYENLIKHITTKLENNKLEINSDLGDSWILGNDKTTVLNITVASLDELSLDGATNAEIHGSLTEKEFKLDISGQGKIKIDSLAYV